VPWVTSASKSEGTAIIPLYLPDAPLRHVARIPSG
jgi:hypothetical protein